MMPGFQEIIAGIVVILAGYFSVKKLVGQFRNANNEGSCAHCTLKESAQPNKPSR